MAFSPFTPGQMVLMLARILMKVAIFFRVETVDENCREVSAKSSQAILFTCDY